MTALFHRRAAVSIVLAAGLLLGAPAMAAPDSPFWGRWQVSDPDAPFSSRGREYKTIDIAPCGKDFCGVSVGAGGKCGPTLFRFLMKRAGGDQELRGTGKWGSGRKNVMIWLFQGAQGEVRDQFQLYLGDGWDFGERSPNMPKFDAIYRKSGVARCKAR